MKSLDESGKNSQWVQWIFVGDQMPPEGEYVLVSFSEYIGISRFIDNEWDIGKGWKLPIFNKSEKMATRASPTHWMTLPKPPKE
jgi:hypothetical protein